MAPTDEPWDDVAAILAELDERTVPSGPPPLNDLDPEGSVLREMGEVPTRKVASGFIQRLLDWDLGKGA